MGLDHTFFPHLFDRIIGYATHDTLSVVARTSRAVRDNIFDNYLPVRHIIADVGAIRLHGVCSDGRAVALDNRMVWTHAAAVRVLDIVEWANPTPLAALGSLERLSLLPNVHIVRHLCGKVFKTVGFVPPSNVLVTACRVRWPMTEAPRALWLLQPGTIVELDSQAFSELVVSTLFFYNAAAEEMWTSYVPYSSWPRLPANARVTIVFVADKTGPQFATHPDGTSSSEPDGEESDDTNSDSDDNIEFPTHNAGVYAYEREDTNGFTWFERRVVTMLLSDTPPREIVLVNMDALLDGHDEYETIDSDELVALQYEWIEELKHTLSHFWDLPGFPSEDTALKRLECITFKSLDEYKAEVGKDYDIYLAQSLPRFPQALETERQAQDEGEEDEGRCGLPFYNGID